METKKQQIQWSPVSPEPCVCGRCKACERRWGRERILRAQEMIFLGCDSACPDRADPMPLLTAA
jgi:hypothetical protein